VKIGVISDTHLAGAEKSDGWRSLMGKGPNTLGELVHRLEQIFVDTDMVIHAGDIITQVVLDELAKFGRVEAVQGNMDRINLPSLSREKVLELSGYRIGVIHGWGAPQGIRQRILERFENIDAVIYGHTHEPFNKTVDDVFFFNPGSPTDNFFAPYKSVGIIEISGTILGEIIKL